MGGACSAYGGGECYIQGFGGETWNRDHMGDQGVDGRIVFRRIFRKWDVGVWTGSSWLLQSFAIWDRSLQLLKRGISSSSSTSYICHGVGPLVDPFRSHVSRSLLKVYHDSFCQLGSSISLPWVIYFETFYLQFVSSFSCIPVICPKLELIFNSFAICAFVLQSVQVYMGYKG